MPVPVMAKTSATSAMAFRLTNPTMPGSYQSAGATAGSPYRSGSAFAEPSYAAATAGSLAIGATTSSLSRSITANVLLFTPRAA